MRENIVEASYTLSPMQEAMLLDSLMAPESGVYIAHLTGALHEALNVPAFQKAWQDISLRHHTLRTAFRWQGLERPQQDVYERVDVPFEIHDWRHITAAAQKSKFEEFLKTDRKKPINPTKAPVMRLTLFQLSDAEFKFVWTYHHIIVDGSSHQVLLDELFQYYDANCAGKEISLPSPPPYQDYITWLRQQDTSKSEVYWRKILAGFSAPTAIGQVPSSDFVNNDRDYTNIEIHISEKVTRALQNIAHENQVSLNNIVQGAWALLLSHYSGEEDIIFGTVRAGRHWGTGNKESMVGLFISTLPIRTFPSSDKLLIPWLQELKQAQFSMREHESTTLADVQKWSDVPRGRALFESILAFLNFDLCTAMQSRGGKWLNREFSIFVDNGYPITLYGNGNSELILQIAYDRSSFDDAMVNRMLGNLKTLLEGMAEMPNRPLSQILILTEAERHQILVEWNNTGVDYLKDKLIHQIFEAQSLKTPDATAVVFEGHRLTYRELNQRANQLAHYLQTQGVGPESLVGIAMERSVEMIIGLYGILKAGAAYVPLDPTYPADRLAYMMEDASVPVLLTQKRLLEKLPTCKAHVICLDTDWDGLIGNQVTDNPTCRAALENLAYVIYTSGSTGKPKGAMNTHAGILNRLLWMQDAYRLTDVDAVLQKTPFSFDVSVWEFFWPLMFGARLVVARPEGHKDSDYLVQTIIEQRITTIHFVPSMLQIFLLAKNVEKCVSLRHVVCSGEALPLELQNRFFMRSNAGLHNLYGPTEASVDVTYWECIKDSPLKTVPIGRPVANTRMYILDRNMQPVPVGVSGELYIGGVQVARGYFNRPELTATHFIPDPFSNDPKARLYRTGDASRYLPDGNIEYMGRLDFQVKIRGNRIELGEIETLLGQHPAVREVIVMVREDTPDDKRIAAYIVPDVNTKVSIAELRDYVKQKLPDYMVPSYFITLDSFPLTPNQKVDRKALPGPEISGINSERTYVAAGNELQRTILNIWQDVLNTSKIGINDNFFEMGGHSLLLVRVYYKLSETITKKFTLTDMFKFPTIGTLADYLSRDESAKDAGAMPDVINRAEARRAAVKQRQQARQKTKE